MHNPDPTCSHNFTLSHLIVDFEVNGLLGLDADDELIAAAVQVGAHLLLVDVAGHVPRRGGGQ